ncbi:RIP homotypic interaction motif-containing protein [Amycolatopsis sp. WAC 04182]|uniref:RIP homotypic interaction motif-containing protein n=1 Tax=Amycolatopsis sp. WAC 04182 TaxID=2203198 RepID=UPI001F184129|nr:RIP homotypic interaction motif-containing protein [Amycolatopsis sp. WAC 04182]
MTALTAGAAAGLKETATSAVKDAYRSLVTAARDRLSRHSEDPAAVSMVEAHAAAPDDWREELAAALRAVDVVDDAVLLAAARDLLSLLEMPGAGTSKYVVSVRGSQGVQVGDGNILHLGDPSDR